MFCDDCEHTKWTKLDLKKIASHLVGKKEDGTDVLGMLLIDEVETAIHSKYYDDIFRFLVKGSLLLNLKKSQ